jgi:hypothetical protein
MSQTSLKHVFLQTGACFFELMLYIKSQERRTEKPKTERNQMINTKTDFEAIGMGFSIAAGWVRIENNNFWITLTATTSGGRAAQKKDWGVLASYLPKGATKAITADCTIVKGFRYEAADQALAALVNVLHEDDGFLPGKVSRVTRW